MTTLERRNLMIAQSSLRHQAAMRKHAEKRAVIEGMTKEELRLHEIEVAKYAAQFA